MSLCPCMAYSCMLMHFRESKQSWKILCIQSSRNPRGLRLLDKMKAPSLFSWFSRKLCELSEWCLWGQSFRLQKELQLQLVKSISWDVSMTSGQHAAKEPSQMLQSHTHCLLVSLKKTICAETFYREVKQDGEIFVSDGSEEEEVRQAVRRLGN